MGPVSRGLRRLAINCRPFGAASNYGTTSLALLAAVLLAAAGSLAQGHSGASGVRVEQQTLVTIRPDAIAITYTTQLNRPGAYLEVLRMDRDGDGQLSAEEQQRYFSEMAKAIVGGLEVRIDDKEVPLAPIGQIELSMPFTKRLRFEIPHRPGRQRGTVVQLHNDNYLDFAGAITVVLDPGTGADVVYDSRWHQEAEDPAAAWGVVPDPQQRDVVFRYRPGTGKSEPVEGVTETPAGSADHAETDEPLLAASGHGSGAITLLVFSAALVLCVLLVVIGGTLGMAPSRLAAGCATIFVLTACLIGWKHDEIARRWGGGHTVPADVEAAQIFQRLHRHIYRAFEQQTESEVYDALARGLEGEVLDEVYNEVYEALLMRGDGSTRFNVRRVKPISSTVLPAEDAADPAFRVRYRWRVYGTVTHFGHTHARFNEYEALYLVRHNGRSWRIAGSEVRQHKRVSIGQT